MFTVDFVRFPPGVKVLDVENPGGTHYLLEMIDIQGGFSNEISWYIAI